ncbi:cold shock and DUF1294 domain-containing protein [Prosthecomicrobium sp. N25]|uniref:cold shock and DUF1294 domain-containing protein n=1 Tax=Prosthecomicrobium sp. N25 TaxID=3129254 RepID=UPI003076E6D6
MPESISAWARGRVVRWNDPEGYGFLAPDAGGPDLFFHVTALPFGGRRPAPGETVEFQPGLDERGRPRAVAVRFEGGWLAFRPPSLPTGVVLAFLALVLAASLWRGLPWWTPAVYLVMSALSGLAYTVDKGRAERFERRVSERTLHALDLLGGWPGGLIVSQSLRHKTAKLSFRVIFWVIAAAHVAFWLTVLGGARVWTYL